jgi:hypothetical protein
MFQHLRRVLLVLSVAAVSASAVTAVSAAPALAYGKANWQAAMTGTFTFPKTGFGFGFWGWCDFAGGVSSGDDADCAIAEYFHNPPPEFGPAFTCELSVDATAWDQSGSTFDGSGPAFAVTGTAVVHPASLTDDQKKACVAFFTGDSTGSTTFSNVNTFIPAAPGHYVYPNPFSDFGAVGEFNFTVTQIE